MTILFLPKFTQPEIEAAVVTPENGYGGSDSTEHLRPMLCHCLSFGKRKLQDISAMLDIDLDAAQGHCLGPRRRPCLFIAHGIKPPLPPSDVGWTYNAVTDGPVEAEGA